MSYLVYGGAVQCDYDRIEWATYEEHETNADDFDAIGNELVANHIQLSGSGGFTRAQLMRQRVVVNFAVD